MALVDAEYKFIWIDVGPDGASSDAQVFNDSELNEALQNKTIGFPLPNPLPGDNRNTEYFLVGDDAFALRPYMMNPFPSRGLTVEERMFNYRLSRARRIVENAFGILALRFQVLLSTMQQEPDTVRLIVKACVCLHNLLRIRYPLLHNGAVDADDQNHRIIPGEWRRGRNMLDAVTVDAQNRDTKKAKKQRNYINHYVNSSAGAVPWQNDMI